MPRIAGAPTGATNGTPGPEKTPEVNPSPAPATLSPVTSDVREAVDAAVAEMTAEQAPAQPENALAESALQQYEQPVDVAGEIQRAAERVAQQLLDQGAKPQAAQGQPGTADVQRKIDVERRRLLREELERQRKQKAEVDAARSEGRRPMPLYTSEIAEMPDESVIADEDGQPAGTAGMHKRIARMKNSDGKIDTNRVNELARWGYRPVLSRVTGKPVTNRLGMLMECDPAAEGRRRAVHEARVTNIEDLKKGFVSQVDDANRAAGRTIGHAFDPGITQTTTTRDPLA